MVRIAVSRKIDAPGEYIFHVVSNIENLPNTNPDILKIEFLSQQKSGIGTRFRETREMKGRREVTELEVTEYVEHERVRMVADSHGTIWDTVFLVRPAGDLNELEIIMDARAHEFLPKILNPVMKRMFKNGIEKHMDALKEYCENKQG